MIETRFSFFALAWVPWALSALLVAGALAVWWQFRRRLQPVIGGLEGALAAIEHSGSPAGFRDRFPSLNQTLAANPVIGDSWRAFARTVVTVPDQDNAPGVTQPPAQHFDERILAEAGVSDLMVGMLFVFIVILLAFALKSRVADDQATQIQRDLIVERDEVGQEADRLAAERDALAAERDRERDELAMERDRLAAERDELGAVTDYLLRNDRIRDDMLAAVQSLLRQRQVEVSLDPENGILRLPESLLFDSAHAVLRPEGARALRELAAVLARTLPSTAWPGRSSRATARSFPGHCSKPS